MRNESNIGRPTIGNSRPIGGNPNRPPNQGNSNSIWLAAAAILSVLILALAVLNFQKYGVFGDDDEESEEAANPEKESESEPTERIEPTQGRASDQFPDSSQLQTLVSQDGTSWVVGHQEDFKYRISGAVPSEEIKQSISESVTNSYGTNSDAVKNELVVDPNLPDAAWLAGSPEIVRAIPFTLVDGAFAINDKNTNLSGQAQNQEQIASVVAAAETAGLPEVKSSIEIVDRRLATIIANADDGELEIFGTVPSQRVVDQIVEDSTNLYGEGNVKQNLAVDEGTFARFGVLELGKSSIGVFYPLGDYTYRLEQGQVTVDIEGGVLFSPGSSSLSPEIREGLKGLPGYISRRSTRPVTVAGHSDNTGDPAENQTLSQARADAVKKYLVDNGAPDATITAEGRGEQAGDTPEERTRNRRVEIAIGGV